MSQWLVTQGDNQFSVEGLGELQRLASAGNLQAGDMIQPPGATDWLYASEIPELEALFSSDEDDDLGDYMASKKNTGAMLTMVVAAIFVAVIIGGAATTMVLMKDLPRGDEVLIGEGGLTYSEMLVTSDAAAFLVEPEAGSRPAASVSKDQALDLLSKRGDYYRAQTKDGVEGWIGADQVIPMYQLGGEDVRAEYDPLYNPDRYVEVVNASWMQLPEQAEDHITVFTFMLRNQSVYPMTDLVILATIKDAKGQELETVEIPVEGLIPPEGHTMVGTLKPENARKKKKEKEQPRLLTNYTFSKMSEEDPDLQLLYSDGVEAVMSTSDFTNANIDLLELRAVPDKEAVEVVTRSGAG